MSNVLRDLELRPAALGTLRALVILSGVDPLGLDPVLSRGTLDASAARRLPAAALEWANLAEGAEVEMALRSSIDEALHRVDPALFAGGEAELWPSHTLQYLVNMLVRANWSVRSEEPSADLGVGTAIAVLRVELLWELLTTADSSPSEELGAWLAQLVTAIREASPATPKAAALARLGGAGDWRELLDGSQLPRHVRASVADLIRLCIDDRNDPSGQDPADLL